jgi:hypothetical protein
MEAARPPLEAAAAPGGRPGLERSGKPKRCRPRRTIGAVLGVAGLGSIAATFEGSGATGASAGGLEAGMLVAAAAAVVAGVAALVLLPRRPRRRR